MKMRFLLVLLIALLLCSAGWAQLPDFSETENIYDFEEKLSDWRQQNPDQKGWKWLARQQNEVLRRADAAGKLPDASVYLNAESDVQQLKQNARLATAAWMPEGPFGSQDLFGIGRASCIAFHPKDSLTHYIGFGQAGIWKTTNGGQSYVPLGDDLPVMRISGIAIDPNNPETIYISVADFAYIGYDLYTADRKRNTYYGLGLYKSTNGGRTWQTTALGRNQVQQQNSLLRSIWINPKNSNELVVVGMQGIYRSSDAAQSWQKVSDVLTSQLVPHPTNPDILFASGIYVGTTRQGEACVLQSSDAGRTWTRLNTGIPPRSTQRVEVAISASHPNIMYAVTCNLSNNYEGFYRSVDSGATWRKSTSKTQILSDSPTGSYGQGIYDLTLIVNPADPNNILVGGLVLFESRNGGDSWQQSTPYSGIIHPDQHYLAYNELNKTYYLCNDGGVYSSKNFSDARQWNFISNNINVTSCYRLGISPDGTGLVAGAQDNNSYYKSSSQPWIDLYGGDGMECAILPDGQTLYVSAQYGSIVYLQNNRYFSVFPPPNNTDTGEWTTPYAIIPATKEVVIAGGNVYKVPFYQGRTSLRKISDFKTIAELKTPQLSSALGVSKLNPNHLYVAKRSRPLYGVNAETFYTPDGGTTWTEIGKGAFGTSYVTYLTVDDEYPERAWLTLSNFEEGKKVFLTNDAGKNWQNVSYNLPNLPANCVAYQPEKDGKAGVLYVGMDVGVYYLIDGEAEWKILSENLPNVIVSELEVNPATNKLFAATFGRGVWSTDLIKVGSKAATDFYGLEYNVFPNPVINIVNIKANYDNIDLIKLVDGRGQVVFEKPLNKKEIKFGISIDVSNYPSAMYYLVLSEGNLRKSIRIMK